MDMDENAKRDHALLGVLKTILLFLESLQLRSTCNILQAECAQMGYPKLHQSQAHILVLRPSESHSSISGKNARNSNHTRGSSKSILYRHKDIGDEGGAEPSALGVDDLICRPDVSAGDMPCIHRSYHDIKRRDRSDREEKFSMPKSARMNEMAVKEKLSQAESLMKKLILHGQAGEVFERQSVNVFFTDTETDSPKQKQHQHHQDKNYNLQPLCSCSSCTEFAIAAAAAKATAEQNARGTSSTCATDGATTKTSGSTCIEMPKNCCKNCNPPLKKNACTNVPISCGYPPPALRKTCSSICTTNMASTILSDEHMKLLAIASNLTHALQSQVRGQSNRIDELLATCRRLCPEFFVPAPCKSACAGQFKPAPMYYNQTCEMVKEDDVVVDADDVIPETVPIEVPPVKVDKVKKKKKGKSSECLIRALDIRKQSEKASESSFNSLDEYGTELDFKKIKRHLLTKSTTRKLALLQALRWRLTKSDDNYRDHTLNSYIRNDLLGLNKADATAFVTKFLADNTSANPKLMQETMARLVNTFASLTLGRDYLSFDDSVVIELLIPLLLEQHESGVAVNEQTRAFVIATLQKLSLRAKIRKIMISEGIVQYILDHISKNLNNMNSYTLEYATALLMNLCLQKEAQNICSSRTKQVVQLMKDLLNSKYECCLLYVNGIMYSLLKNSKINQEALNAKLDEDINDAMHYYSANTELIRQFEVILTLHREGGDSELEHACANTEPDEELDILEAEIDMDDTIEGNDNILLKYRIKIDVPKDAIALTALCNPTTPRSSRSAFRPNSANSSEPDNIIINYEPIALEYENDSDEEREQGQTISNTIVNKDIVGKLLDYAIAHNSTISNDKGTKGNNYSSQQQNANQSKVESRKSENGTHRGKEYYTNVDGSNQKPLQEEYSQKHNVSNINGEERREVQRGERKQSDGDEDRSIHGLISTENIERPITQVSGKSTNSSKTIPSESKSSKEDTTKTELTSHSNSSYSHDEGRVYNTHNKNAKGISSNRERTISDESNASKGKREMPTNRDESKAIPDTGTTQSKSRAGKSNASNVPKGTRGTTKYINESAAIGDTDSIHSKSRVKPSNTSNVSKGTAVSHETIHDRDASAVIDLIHSNSKAKPSIVSNASRVTTGTHATINDLYGPKANGETNSLNSKFKSPSNISSASRGIAGTHETMNDGDGSKAIQDTDPIHSKSRDNSTVPQPKGGATNASRGTPGIYGTVNDGDGSKAIQDTDPIHSKSRDNSNVPQRKGRAPNASRGTHKTMSDRDGSKAIQDTDSSRSKSRDNSTVRQPKGRATNASRGTPGTHGTVNDRDGSKAIRDSEPTRSQPRGGASNFSNRVAAGPHGPTNTRALSKANKDTKYLISTTKNNAAISTSQGGRGVDSSNRSSSVPPTSNKNKAEKVLKFDKQKNLESNKQKTTGAMNDTISGSTLGAASNKSKQSSKTSVCIEIGRATEEKVALMHSYIDRGYTIEEAIEKADILSARSEVTSQSSENTVCCGHELMSAQNQCHADCIMVKEQKKAVLPETGCWDLDKEAVTCNKDTFKRKSTRLPNNNRKDSNTHWGPLQYGVDYPDPLDVRPKAQLNTCERKCERKCDRKCEVARKRFCARANQQCPLMNAKERPAWYCSIQAPTALASKVKAPTVKRAIPPLLPGCCRPEGKELAYASRCATEALRNYKCDCYQEIRNFLTYHNHNAWKLAANENRNCVGSYGMKRCCRDRSQ